jgi:hypothetical protein
VLSWRNCKNLYLKYKHKKGAAQQDKNDLPKENSAGANSKLQNKIASAHKVNTRIINANKCIQNCAVECED